MHPNAATPRLRIRHAQDHAPSSHDPVGTGGFIASRQPQCQARLGTCPRLRARHVDDTPDYVIATGQNHSVREFAERAFQIVGLNYRNYVVTDSAFFRPAEVEML